MNDNLSPANNPPGHGLQKLLMIVGIGLALALVLFWNLRQAQKRSAAANRLPSFAQLDVPLKGVNHRGEPVSFADLKGKVWVLAYVYTECPAGCAGVMGRLKELQDEFAADADQLHFVAVSLDADNDTPEKMAAWGKAGERNMGDGNWWFMTGETKPIHDYMAKYFKLHVTKRTDPAESKAYGPWEHEFKLVLVDQKGTIRYYYDVLGATYSEAHLKKIRKDIRQLLD